MSGWMIFTICFTTLLVGAWSALTILEFYRANRRMREAEVKGLDPRAGAAKRSQETAGRPGGGTKM